MAKKRDDEREEKILDVDASMQGTIAFKDPVNLRINGSFEGKLDAKGNLTIGENARVKANINGDRVIIAGKVTGNINATESISIVAPALVRGDIAAPRLSIADGSIFDGRISMTSAKEKQGSPFLTDMLDLRDVAQFLEVEEKVLEEWAHKKKIPAFQEDGHWRFRRTEIEKWVEQERVNV
ncbi:MAG: polymer-forming cytoskeletal protein [Candidatus Omnitrophica bacterium]|nr:polymer-forming cytoskeletal protein [Candidatus Omnitrophota bacterium]